MNHKSYFAIGLVATCGACHEPDAARTADAGGLTDVGVSVDVAPDMMPATQDNGPNLTTDTAIDDGGPDDLGTANNWWKPTPGTSWQWQLSGQLDRSIDVAMYDIDLVDADAAEIAALQAGGRVVICYFSAGTYEDWRPDKDSFMATDYGEPLPEWPGEYWLDLRSANVRQIMQARLEIAVQKGCDGVEPDNVDGYANDNGLGLTRDDQIDYNTFIAAQAHARGLSVGLKNALELVAELEPYFDWALNEECYAYDECAMLQPFLDANKAVFHTEYVDRMGQGVSKQQQVCGRLPTGFSTLIKLWELDAWYLTCP